ncbi:MAG: Ig-like domain-containing protein [Planctomycetes bacterium]|nr:Ig-like domain-containing protein [Planctomycetota bacterium]
MFPNLPSWINNLFLPRLSRTIVRRPNRLEIELLEDRCVPSVNHAPVGATNSATTLENTARVFQLSDFGFTDPDDGPSPNNFLAVVIDSLPVFGTFTNNGQNISTNQAISVSDINAGYVQFTPSANVSGSSLTGFYFRVQDDGGTAGDPNDPMSFGHDTDATSRYMNINVTWVNQTPSFTASDPGTTDENVNVSIPNWATFNPGAPNETYQTATYLVYNVSDPAMFSAQPTVSTSGTLSYALAPYVHGWCTFDVKVKDDGGTENGAIDTSSAMTFTLIVRPRVTFAVNTTADSDDVNILENQSLDGVAADANGLTSLRAALQEANGADAQTDVMINFNLQPNATINLEIPLPDLTGRVNINVLGTNQITLNRNAVAAFRILFVAPAASVNIGNVRMTNGNAAGQNDAGRGGGILNFGNLDLHGATLANNRSAVDGGAIANFGSLRLSQCNVDDNETQGTGGGLYNGGGNTWITNETVVSNNRAASGGGVGILANSQVTIDHGSAINWNRATGTTATSGEGGGIANYGFLEMSDATLSDNRSVNRGGGLYTSNSATLTNVTITNNEATSTTTGKGGGIYARSGIMTLVSGCTLGGNTAWVDEGGNGLCYTVDVWLDARDDRNTICDNVVNDQNP